MNERIKELAVQADAYAWEQIDEGANFDEQPKYFTEKFAKLIIEEVHEVIVIGGVDDLDVVMKHFGIEE